jgi:hypothetical protein
MNVLEGWLRDWGRKEDANTLRREIEELMGIGVARDIYTLPEGTDSITTKLVLMDGCIFVFAFCRFIQITEKAVLNVGRALKFVPLCTLFFSFASSKIK